MPSFAALSDRGLRLFRAACVEQEEGFEGMGWTVEKAMRSGEAGGRDVALVLFFLLAAAVALYRLSRQCHLAWFPPF